MIPTLSNYLYIMNRDRAYLQEKFDKRRTFVLTLLLFTVVAVGVMAWILQ